MNKTVIITRPKGDEQALTDAFHEMGLRVIHEPLMEIFLRHQERAAIEQALMDDPDAILITSRHGVQALALLTDLRDPYLICVGEATADTAQSLGFTRVTSAGGTVEKLIDYIAACYDEDARFLYISGEHIRTDLAEALLPLGMQVDRIVVYDAHPAQRLSDTLIEQLKRGQVDGVTFMSPRTAQIFVELLRRDSIESLAESLDAFCLSDAVANPLEALEWNHVHVAEQPTLASLVACVNNSFTE